MCYSASNQNEKEMKEEFLKCQKQRVKYCSQRQLSSAFLCMLKYMESVLYYKLGYSNKNLQSDENRPKEEINKVGIFQFLPCSGKMKPHNVREQFKKSYVSCELSQQFDYYKKCVIFLTGKDLTDPAFDYLKKIRNSDQQDIQLLSFYGNFKKKLRWSELMHFELIPERHRLIIKSHSGVIEENINFRNYIFRWNEKLKQNVCVFENIVRIEPNKLKIKIQNNNLNAKQIIEKLKIVADDSLRQNVIIWRQPVLHITLKDQMKEVKQNRDIQVFHKSQGKTNRKPQPQMPKIGIKSGVNDPLKNLILGKMKYGVLKQVQEYNESVGHARSKKKNPLQDASKQKFLGPVPKNLDQQTNQKSKFLTPKNKNMPLQQQNKTNIQNFYVKQNQDDILQTRSSKLLNKAKKDTSSVKSKMNEDIENFYTEKSQKRHSKNINFAQAPPHTRSQTGTPLSTTRLPQEELEELISESQGEYQSEKYKEKQKYNENDQQNYNESHRENSKRFQKIIPKARNTYEKNLKVWGFPVENKIDQISVKSVKSDDSFHTVSDHSDQ